jgi:hypothetical protein
MRASHFYVPAIALVFAVMAPAAGRALDDHGNGTSAASAGGGHYTITRPDGTFVMQFGYSAVVHGDGRATGQLHHRGFFQGQFVEFFGEVTCLAVDPANHRAWIGGVITENGSEHPGFQTPVHQPGHDIWFRVLDADADEDLSGEPDRTTFVGFEGDIPSSEAYCRDRIWPDGNARTWPVQGNVSVRP